MKIIYCLVCVLLLSSCVYYGIQRDFDIGRKTTKPACDTGSKRNKEKCRADLRAVNKSIQAQKNNEMR